MVYNILKHILIGYILTVIIQTPRDVLHEFSVRFKSRRLALKLTQEGLAKRAGMSWSSLKRFERTGQISFESLLNVALVLDCLSDFNTICIASSHKSGVSLDEILASKKIVKRGHIK